MGAPVGRKERATPLVPQPKGPGKGPNLRQLHALATTTHQVRSRQAKSHAAAADAIIARSGGWRTRPRPRPRQLPSCCIQTRSGKLQFRAFGLTTTMKKAEDVEEQEGEMRGKRYATRAPRFAASQPRGRPLPYTTQLPTHIAREDKVMRDTMARHRVSQSDDYYYHTMRLVSGPAA